MKSGDSPNCYTTKVIDYLLKQRGIDFSGHCKSMVESQLNQRLNEIDTGTLTEYYAYLHSHPDELDTLIEADGVARLVGQPHTQIELEHHRRVSTGRELFCCDHLRRGPDSVLPNALVELLGALLRDHQVRDGNHERHGDPDREEHGGGVGEEDHQHGPERGESREREQPSLPGSGGLTGCSEHVVSPRRCELLIDAR